jgi:anaerobic ribonucleoside-triphosphate reductase activating protein
VGPRVARTVAEGPGSRYALWLQGCRLGCPGCCNPHLLDPAGGEEVEVAALVREILAVKAEVEGVTLLGGEPFDQAAPAAALCRAAREAGLSVMVFTGYTLEELLARSGDDVADLLAATDLLVDGRYDRARPERARRWVGSENQRFHFLSGRYARGIERAAAGELERTVEVRIGPDGRVILNGWPEGISIP